MLVLLVVLLRSCTTPVMLPKADSLNGTTEEPLLDDQKPSKTTCSVDSIETVALLLLVAV
jgi:hypothetical protein